MSVCAADVSLDTAQRKHLQDKLKLNPSVKSLELVLNLVLVLSRFSLGFVLIWTHIFEFTLTFTVILSHGL